MVADTFVEMTNDNEAQTAIDAMNGQAINGRPLMVNEARPRELAADATRRLDVLGGRLRLADDRHQAEPRHVHAHGDHVGGQDDVDRAGITLLAARVVAH